MNILYPTFCLFLCVFSIKVTLSISLTWFDLFLSCVYGCCTYSIIYHTQFNKNDTYFYWMIPRNKIWHIIITGCILFIALDFDTRRLSSKLFEIYANVGKNS